MNFKSIKKTFFILFSSLFLVACSQKNNNIDIDLSNLPKPKNPNITQKENNQPINFKDKKYIPKNYTFWV